MGSKLGTFSHAHDLTVPYILGSLGTAPCTPVTCFKTIYGDAVCECIQVCGFVGCACVCTCMWKPEIKLEDHSSGAVHLTFGGSWPGTCRLG